MLGLSQIQQVKENQLIRGKAMSSNQLKNQKSAYLRQHQDNPIHWYAYGEEALKKAKDENKPIFLSIGYSSCHWCHVMAHESFEDQITADFLNENFINIKVDREEHPDIDQYYQLACQVYAGRGGWPLSAFLTSDMKPFFLGTYFPKVGQKDHPAFMEVAEKLKDAYKDDKETVDANAEKLLEAIIQNPNVENQVEFEGHFPAPASILNVLENYQDKVHGGYGAAPKFPMFAFYEWAVEHMLEGMIPEEFGKHIVESIERMLMGGMYDHAKGGIHRYSTDEKFMVPHFEKMLYDQAGLLKLLSKVTLIYPVPLLYDAIIQTLEYLQTEMQHDDGYFFAAQDADSEGSEGLYFTFTKDEFLDALIQFDETLVEKQDQILKWFQITDEGNFEKKLNVISLDPSLKAEYYNPEGWDVVRKVRQALAEERKGRMPPATDNKGVAGWNFQLMSALIDVVQYCRIDLIRQQASSLLHQCIEASHKAFITTDGDTEKMRIKHTTTNDRNIPLFEDYVFFAEYQLRFYELSGNEIFKKNGFQTLIFIFNEFFKDGYFYTRSIHHNDSEPYKNIHTQIFDQSHRSPLGTVIYLVRKWAVVAEMSDLLTKIEPLTETLTHLSLQNPLAFGETLRSLVYPIDAYRKIEVPRSWTTDTEYLKFFPNFSVRFALTYHDRDDDTWQICTQTSCELQGKGIEEFSKVFTPPNKEEVKEETNE